MGETMVFHDFTDTIISQIKATLKVDGKELLQVSPLLEYINIKQNLQIEVQKLVEVLQTSMQYMFW